jgi:ATP-dependent helicase/nuclease subunit A
MSELKDAGVKPADLDRAFGIICEHDEVEFPPGDGARPDAISAWKALNEFYSEISSLMPDPFDPEDHAVRKGCDRAQGSLQGKKQEWPDLLAELLCLSKAISSRQQAMGKWREPWKSSSNKVRDLFDRFRSETVTHGCDCGVSTSITCDKGSHRSKEQPRRRATPRKCSQLHRPASAAATLLRTNPTVRRELQEKHRWILVDEFQDTDPIQAEVLLLMAADENHAGDQQNVDWSTVKLRPGALFIVGDPKQSIYRFRRADIEIYNIVRGLIEASDGEVLSLTACWRSLPEVCSLQRGFSGPISHSRNI